ncbi:MAG: hypothetical protein ACYTKD_01200 [Planctomycetota bacterium]|jgi:hypothetical protein
MATLQAAARLFVDDKIASLEGMLSRLHEMRRQIDALSEPDLASLGGAGLELVEPRMNLSKAVRDVVSRAGPMSTGEVIRALVKKGVKPTPKKKASIRATLCMQKGRFLEKDENKLWRAIAKSERDQE